MTNLAISAATSLLSAVPKGQLARFGLAKAAPAAAPIPFVGVVAAGALVTALAVPKSRRWIVDQAKGLYVKARDATSSFDASSSTTESRPESVGGEQHVIPQTA